MPSTRFHQTRVRVGMNDEMGPFLGCTFPLVDVSYPVEPFNLRVRLVLAFVCIDRVATAGF